MDARTSEPRRIALIGPFRPYRGGIAQFMESIREGMRRRGVAVQAFTFSRQYPDVLFPGKSQFEEGEAGEAVEAPMVLDSINPLTWFRTATRVAAMRPERVVFSYWLPFLAPCFGTVARLLRRRGIPSSAVVHNALPHERRPGDRLLGRYFLRACRSFVAMSSAVENDIRNLVPGASVVRVGHPVYDAYGEAVPSSLARSRLALSENAPVLLFFGFVRPYKGLDVLLRALPAVLRALPETRLVVAGECYDDESQYRSLTAELGLSESVLFHTRYIPTEEVATYFCAADLVVQPYRSATQSGVAQIAFHFGKPMVLTDVGGLAETIAHGRAGLVVPPEDPAALGEAIVRFFREGLAQTMQEEVRKAGATHGWDTLTDALLAPPA